MKKDRTPRTFQRFGRGFTLIEVAIYTALFAAISLVIVESIIATVNSFSALRSTRDLNDTAMIAMERVTREIKWAQTANLASSAFGTTSGRIFLNTTNASGTAKTIDIYAQNGDLRIRENGVDQGSLISGRTNVVAFVLYYVTAGSTSVIKIELTLRAGSGKNSNTHIFYDTAILRDSY
jgi:type II secretory pathway pseudopilin PulG